MKSPNYVAVLAILNAILHRVSESMPLIDQATRELGAVRLQRRLAPPNEVLLPLLSGRFYEAEQICRCLFTAKCVGVLFDTFIWPMLDRATKARSAAVKQILI